MRSNPTVSNCIHFNLGGLSRTAASTAPGIEILRCDKHLHIVKRVNHLCGISGIDEVGTDDVAYWRRQDRPRNPIYQ